MPVRHSDELKLGDFGSQGIRFCPFCGARQVVVEVRPGLMDYKGNIVKILVCQACKAKCGCV